MNTRKLEYDRAYSKRLTPEQIQAKRVTAQKWYRANKERKKKYVKNWVNENRDTVRMYVNGRRAKVRDIRIDLNEISNWESRICGICQKLIDGKYEFDHIIPLSRNGEHKAENLQLAHPPCNRLKHNKLPEEIVVIL